MLLCSQQISDQTTRANNYYCYQNSSTLQITLSSSAHTAWQSTSNCSVQQCNISLDNDNNCRSSSIPCCNYLSFNSTSDCAPGILCSILQPCNNVILSCGSNDFVSFVNSCCTPQPVCLPILLTSFCRSGWFNTGSMINTRAWHTASVLTNETVSVTGKSSGYSLQSSVELYDPLTGSWTKTGSMNNP
ncbi:unnamed protein product [Rotaria magnacalcarata]|uniref:Uncharacterized protein n=1 Tax=Rotaria magnacalcarata TaxID=392030 RepID=A0A814WJR7_9BILA|nr:unnamed protein product [Rotaria magnacalcarata]